MGNAESREIRTLRIMAWERAKGELQAMRNTYWDNHEKYTRFSVAVETFIAEVESHGLHE